MYVPLKIVSEYTLLSSTIRIEELMQFLKNNNITACALVDNNLYGVMDFYNKCISNNIKPIIGLSIVIEGYDLYLYAINYEGYKNLLKIHTLKEFNKLDFDGLDKYLDNIKIVLPFNSYDLLDKYKEAYLGYSNDTEKIEALFKSERVVFVREADSLTQEDTSLIKYLRAIDKGVSVKTITHDYSFNYLNLNIKEEDKISTINFSKDINIVIDNKENYIPKYDKDKNSEEFLVNLAYKGLTKRLGGVILPNYKERLDYELGVIKKMGFVDYFLIVYDYVLYAKKNNILVGPGRGSAAGSLVSFSLGITNVDPIKYNLLFERFLNPERITMPDIDIDFEYTKRGQVILYVRERYGEFQVAPIMTFGTLGSKQVIRDIGRVMEIDSSLIDRLAKVVDAKLKLEEIENTSNIKMLVDSYPELKNLYVIAKKLEGIKRHISTHAAGVVICNRRLDEVIPVINNNGFIMTGVTMEYLEALGLLKMDFLALRNLTIISNVLELIKKKTGKMIDLNKIDLNDKSVFKLFSEGDTEGVFQYESSGMKNLMRKLKPSSFSDLVASVALFRPGPMDNIDMFIRRKYKQEKIVYLHPDLEPILKETYGVIVYQEQVMQVLVKIGGYTYAEADNIRRAMSKKKESVMQEDKKHFIASAVARGYREEVATQIYDLILKFARYGFNKAHSVSYALIGYQMAYLKVKAPLYFITNLLNMSLGSDIKTKEYIDEAKLKGIKIKQPDINISTNDYLIMDDGLMLPLSSVKNLGSASTNSLLLERESNGEFKDYLDFVSRCYKREVNKKVIVSLIDAGLLDSFNLNKRTMIENLDIAINYASLISNLDSEYVVKPEIVIKEEYEESVLREKEYNSYGFYLKNHPVSIYQDKSVVKIKDVRNYFDKHIKWVVMIERIKIIETKKGEKMAFVTGSDDTGNIDLVFFASTYYMLNNLKKGDIIMGQGRVTKRFDTYQINVVLANKV